MVQIPKIPPARSIEVFTGVVILIFVLFVNRNLESQYDRYRVPRTDGDQGHYQNEPGSRGRILSWLELGRDGRRVVRVGDNGIDIDVTGFDTGEYFQREIYWAYRTEEGGSVLISFPHESPVSEVGIFAVDGDSFYRIGVARSGDQAHMLDDLHNGRWFWFNVTESELSAGQKQIHLSHLMGKDLAISAILVAGE